MADEKMKQLFIRITSFTLIKKIFKYMLIKKLTSQSVFIGHNNLPNLEKKEIFEAIKENISRVIAC